MLSGRPRPSLGGRRLALQRKFVCNYDYYGGSVMQATITGPGAEVLPWDTDKCSHPPGVKCSGKLGCVVEWLPYGYVNEATAQARMSRLWEAAARSADRYVRRMWKGRLPVQLSNVRSPQLRGVSHFHYGMPMGSEIERAWSRHVRRFIEAQARREAALPAFEVWAALEREWRTGEITRGLYGVGYVKFTTPKAGASGVARYQARNAAGYQASQEGAKRHYVSTRLTEATGITMRKLRACNWLAVRRRLIREGQLEDGEVPGYWSPEWAAEVLRVMAIVEPVHGP